LVRRFRAQVLGHLAPGPAQVPDGLLQRGRHPDGDQLPGRCRRDRRRQSRVSVLTLSPGALGIIDGAITSHATPICRNSRARS
jgi:hypothetical protein